MRSLLGAYRERKRQTDRHTHTLHPHSHINSYSPYVSPHSPRNKPSYLKVRPWRPPKRRLTVCEAQATTSAKSLGQADRSLSAPQFPARKTSIPSHCHSSYSLVKARVPPQGPLEIRSVCQMLFRSDPQRPEPQSSSSGQPGPSLWFLEGRLAATQRWV